MGMRINHNIAAMNAWRNLGVSNNSLGGSLEKLSSGFRINRGADDPAGLLISEKLRGQITGLDQAVKNASDAISMVQTAEGALTEMNSMLNSIRGLAVHAANSGANDTASVAADQTAVQKAITSMQRIAETTTFGGKMLLDGTAGGGAATADKTAATWAGVTLSAAVTLGSISDKGTYNINVTAGASQAQVVLASNSLIGALTSANVAATSTVINVTVKFGDNNLKNYTITFAGSTESYAIGIASIQASIAGRINADTVNSGVTAAVDAGTNTLSLTGSSVGTKVLDVHVENLTTASGVGSATLTDTGANMTATMTHNSDSSTLNASGNLVFVSAGAAKWANFQASLDATTTQTATFGVALASGTLQFALTQDAKSTDMVNLSIDDMQTTAIGAYTSGGTYHLNDIASTGAVYNLASYADKAVTIIDQAIEDVSNQRASLGAFQKYTLESTINNLGVTRENLQSSESRIRDVDMAEEMLSFTKNQILVQAGTAMLAQANQLPQTVLQLLK